MTFRILLLVTSLLLGACNINVVQVALLHPTSPKVTEGKDHYVFDNDTVRIVYSFWAKHCPFGFSIENKLSTPIYIDWKKSNLVYNNAPNVYWTDETIVKTKSVTTGVGYRVTSQVSVGAANTSEESVIRPKERITFLPPSSKIERNEYSIENAAYYVMDLSANGETVPNDSKPEKMTKVYRQSFSEESSPINLTNFLTLSSKENFEQEWFIENSFYLKEVTELELSHFRGKCDGNDENGMEICPRLLKSNKKFLLYVPKGWDFERRKKMKMTKYVDPYKGAYADQ